VKTLEDKKRRQRKGSPEGVKVQGGGEIRGEKKKKEKTNIEDPVGFKENRKNGERRRGSHEEREEDAGGGGKAIKKRGRGWEKKVEYGNGREGKGNSSISFERH